ncbi:hypothetical protein OG455_14350 [Kitasatospora sp. NBC_01287]|uniref:hypothetical protein n=1 Tax=Kitasatospora sp. NBC_01287 TaxID=2903573 RepID=UPI00224EEF0E|nr:hypothetical protein [Kitasatospora sp. NBC_01287]MCX4746685.1 hypothetical protein [Kitasatospora sp. NBC_01287]
MAAFSPSQHEAVVDKLNSGLPKAQNNVAVVRRNAYSVSESLFLPPGAGDVIKHLADEVVKAFKWLLDEFVAVMEGVGAPLLFWENADQWQTIRGLASTVAGQTTPGVLGSTGDWTGDTATAYTKAIAPQSTAAASLASIADKTSQALVTCAGTGLAFYATIALLLVQFIGIQVAAAAADTTVVGAIPGLLVALGGTASTGSLMLAALVGIGALLGPQATQMVTLHGLAMDNGAFPGGHWPKATDV